MDIRQSAKDENGNISCLSVAQPLEVDELGVDLSSPFTVLFLISFFFLFLFFNNTERENALIASEFDLRDLIYIYMSLTNDLEVYLRIETIFHTMVRAVLSFFSDVTFLFLRFSLLFIVLYNGVKY